MDPFSYPDPVPPGYNKSSDDDSKTDVESISTSLAQATASLTDASASQ